MNDFEDIILFLILILRLELWQVTEEKANMTQLHTCCVLLHPNSKRKFNFMKKKKAYLQACVPLCSFNVKYLHMNTFSTPLQVVSKLCIL